MIAVGAIDRHLQVTPYSAKGADLDLVAPGGSEVQCPCSAGIWILGTGDSLICKIGTSFAAPHVCGRHRPDAERRLSPRSRKGAGPPAHDGEAAGRAARDGTPPTDTAASTPWERWQAASPG